MQALRYHDGMPYRPFVGQNCSIAGALAVIGERWTLLILREVFLGRRRFAEIQRTTGVATNILSDRLETLVERGVLVRRPVAGDGEAHEYVATAKGADLMPVLLSLIEWGDRYECGPQGPPRVAVHATCGHDAHPHLTCSHCGEKLQPRDVRMRPGPGADADQREQASVPA